MNADRLLALYDRVADAEGAIVRLRRFVLDLAVRGKLVAQDSADEPASELLKRIAAEKARLVKSGEIRKPEPITPVSADEVPFGVPTGWQGTQLGAVIDLLSGQHLQPPEYSETPNCGVPYITGPADFSATGLCINRYALVRKAVARKGQLLLTVKGSGVGKTTICDLPEVAISRQLMALTPIGWDLGYLSVVTHRLAQRLQEQARSLIPGIAREDVEDFVFPLPPLAEQRRIVAKVEELMALLDRLEAARTTREATRCRLTAASLARLTAPDANAESFPAHARFALDALPVLTTRPDQIKALRQTILNLAVRGKLVEPDPADEPASELLKRIAAEKKRLGIKHSASPLSVGEVPFDLPAGWSWTRIGEICSKTGSGSTPRGGKDVYKKSGVLFLRSQNVYDESLRLDDAAFIDAETHERMKGTRVLPGDLLLNITGGSMGRCGRVPEDFGEANVSQHVAIIRPAVKGMERFLHGLVLSPYFQAFIFDEQTGAGRGGLPKNRMDRIAVALPPLAEQHRIVAKVDALIALCDRLETALVAVNTNRRRLLEVLLQGALAPSLELRPAAE